MINLRHSLLKWFNMNRYGDIALIRLEGCRFLLAKKNRLDMKIMGGMDWERGLRDRAVAEIKRHHLDLLIDVGANLGLYTVDLNRRCAVKETIAFEPQPGNFNQLCGNIFANGLSDRVTAERSALSDRDGTATMNVDTAFTIHSTLEAFGANNAKFDKSIEVPLKHFDDHYPFENRRIYLKIDVEGHEMSTLRGMTRLLARNKVSLQVEADDHNVSDVTEFLTALGYRPAGEMHLDRFFNNI